MLSKGSSTRSGRRYFTPEAMTSACLQDLSIVEDELVGLRVAVEAECAAADCEVGAELLGLREGAPRELFARDARGEAEVVLDARARAGLAARRRRLEHEHVEALGRRVHGRGQARRPGAHDDEISHDVRVERRAVLQLAREALDGRVLEDLAFRADDDGHLVDADLKSIEQRLHGGVRLDVLVREGLRVAREELRSFIVLAEWREPTTSGPPPGRDQPHAAQDERRGFGDLGELGVALHEEAQVLAVVDDDEPAVTRHTPASRARGDPTAC